MIRSRALTLVRTAAVACALTGAGVAQLFPPPVPFENPVTAAKAVLGKALFWDEQLSSDNTVSCGSCHRPVAGGADSRVILHPGPDGRRQTADDSRTSPGIARSTSDGRLMRDPLFHYGPQGSTRTSATAIGAPWFATLRWDGIAVETFVDPQTGRLEIMFGGALENHAAGPAVDDLEMAYRGRTWNDVTAKIARSKPLRLATSLPGDLTTALQGVTDYGDLMQRAFGDRAVTAKRIIFALATYQRTLVPDRTPWDEFARGNSSALSAAQQRGLALFNGKARCAQCHRDPLFSDETFRNLGIRPVGEDLGWQLATLDPSDRGKFKVPTLRNAGLRPRFMHNGQFASLEDVIAFYDAGGGAFADNKDPLLVPLGLTAAERADLVDFVRNGLTDPRVAAETAPFDVPTLWADGAPGRFGAAHPGSGGLAPQSFIHAPLAAGNAEFRLGVFDALGGSTAALLFAGSRGPAQQKVGPIPIHVALVPPPIALVLPLSGAGAGDGDATYRTALPNDPNLVGATLVHQWLVLDPGAAGGYAATSGSSATFF